MASEGKGARSGAGAESLAEAIESLAKALQRKPEAPRESRLWKALVSFATTILPSLVMFGLGYAFIQGVELDLKREEFTAATADKLKSYVQDLMKADTHQSLEELKATALALGGFGGVATFPLVSVIEFGGEQRIASAMLGLEQAGRIAPDASCAAMTEVIDDSTKAYKWETRKAVTEVAGLVGCAQARAPLRRLRPQLASMGLGPEQVSNFQAAIDKALERIEAARRRNTSWWCGCGRR